MRKRERRRAVLKCVKRFTNMRNEFFFGICDTGMFSLTVLLCDDDDGDEDSWQKGLNV